MGLGACLKLNVIYMTSFFWLLVATTEKASAVVLRYRGSSSIHGSVCICLFVVCRQPWKAALRNANSRLLPSGSHESPKRTLSFEFPQKRLPTPPSNWPHHPPTLFKTSRGEGPVVLGKVELQWEAKAECWTGLLKVQDLGWLLVAQKRNTAAMSERTVLSVCRRKWYREL